MQTIYDKLREYSKSEDYPFHMPGHKRRAGALPEVRDLDITEIEGFDNLHHATGIIKEGQERAASLYGSEETYYLVNGSTAGILAAISACTTYKGRILMARNSHKAAYHAVQIRGLQATYLYPEREGVADVEQALAKDPKIQAVYITSPTYEGTLSDVRAIARVAHKYGKPLIVDEAHGAHFGFHPYFPESSVRGGADLVIHSVHKTLPSLTQTALLHRNGKLIDGAKVKEYLDIYQTSSPSYLLMASIDQCVKMIAKEKDSLFAAFSSRLQELYDRAKSLQVLHVWPASSETEKGSWDEKGKTLGRDPSKIVISAGKLGGKWLGEKLRKEYHIQPEMELADYVVLLTSVADTQEGFDRLWSALKKIDWQLGKQEAAENSNAKIGKIQPEIVMTIAEASEGEREQVRLLESQGRISCEYIYLYPPGIPMLVPGERISRHVLETCERCREEGYDLQGLKDYSGTYIDVYKADEYGI